MADIGTIPSKEFAVNVTDFIDERVNDMLVETMYHLFAEGYCGYPGSGQDLNRNNPFEGYIPEIREIVVEALGHACGIVEPDGTDF